MKAKKDDWQQYVFYLEWDLDKWRNGRTQVVWAQSREEAERKVQSWKHFGFTPKYLHTMEELRERTAADAAKEARIAKVKTAPAVESENV